MPAPQGATGHLLGAAGAVEAIFSVLAVAQVGVVVDAPLATASCTQQRNTLMCLLGCFATACCQSSIPPTANLECLDPAIAELSGSVEVVGGEARSQPVRAALSNSFGFGGTNASLLFSAI